MVLWVLLVVGSLWIHGLTQSGRAEDLSREAVLTWFKERVLESLELEAPPVDPLLGRLAPRRVPRTSRTAWLSQESRTPRIQETSQIILFPGSDSAPEETSSPFTYHFQPSVNKRTTVVTSAHFWFYAGEGSNSSAPLFILTSSQQLLQAAEAPSNTSSDGWTTYTLDQNLLHTLAEGRFLLSVRCPTCQFHADEDKMPFLHLHARPRGPARSARSAAATVPWSPAAVDLLQRPSHQRPKHSHCQRAEVEISVQELGWENWIVHPNVLTFYYCHGNCSARDGTSAVLGITQCCAPVPGTMKSMRITTTSDGGYSFRYETLPNIVPEECTCI